MGYGILRGAVGYGKLRGAVGYGKLRGAVGYGKLRGAVGYGKLRGAVGYGKPIFEIYIWTKTLNRATNFIVCTLPLIILDNTFIKGKISNVNLTLSKSVENMSKLQTVFYNRR